VPVVRIRLTLKPDGTGADNSFMTGPFPVRSLPSGRSALLTYEPYYGLREKPFSLSVDPHFLYKSRSHAPVFDDLLAGIRRREGLIVLTGDIGNGKTTLCRAVLEHLDGKTFSTFVPDPFVSREDLLKMLLIDFGVMSVDDLKAGRLNGASRPELTYLLYEFLNSLVPLQAFAVLIIDEAQNLSLPLLEEIRILSDLEAPEKLLQVVLVGQLEFQAKLKLPEMRQVDQRVSVRCTLKPLDAAGVGSYIAHRLQVAGATRDRVSFAASAVELIAERTGGVPRLINLICDRALYRGHLARTSLIDSDIVRVAMIDLGLTEIPDLPIPVAIQESPAPLFSLATSLDPEPPAPRTPPPEPVLPLAALPEPSTPAPPMPSVRESKWQFEPMEPTAQQGEVFFDEPRPVRTNRSSRTKVAAAVGVTAVLLLAAVGYGQGRWKQRDQITAAPPVQSSVSSFQPKRGTQEITPPPAIAVPAAAPARPAPSAGPFAIDVALFNSTARASRLAAELTAANYPAYVRNLDLGDRGRLYQVRIGPFTSREAADAEVARVHAMPGYADARVAPPPTP